MPPSIANTLGLLTRALAAHQSGNIAEAEFLYKLVLQADRKQFDALHMLGVIEGQRGNFAAGLRHIKDALRIRPNAADALINLGRMQSELGEDAFAAASYKKALALNPRSALAHNNLSALLRRQRRREDALVHGDAAVAIAPEYADAWNNRGNILFDLDRMSEALASYDRALAMQPNIAQAHLGRANVLQQMMRPAEALAAYERALAAKSDLAEAWFGRGMALGRLRRLDEAYASYAKAYALKPDLAYVEGQRLLAKMQICDWDGLEAECAHLAAAVAQGAPRSRPGTMLVASASPAVQRTCAESYAADQHPASAQPLWRGERYRHDRIRIAYISPDFRDHPVSYLAAGMFEAHDRSRFEITAVSIAPETDDEMQARLRGAFDRFLDVRARTDSEIANILRDLEIDIAVDLGGLTDNSRPGALAQRGVPVQVNYLGYPGTMGASYMDYIVADRTVIPAEHAAFYSEQIVWLPDTYQANDAGRRIAERTPARDELGLPPAGFVFCCFNSCYKIGPSSFHIWARLLTQVEGAVLWLFEENDVATRNLRLEAQRRGIAPERLVFAPRVPLAEHLARHRCADLFLDTLPYNAHTTASDALWAGLPVVTCVGTTFAGRVAASLLHAVGLAELVTESLPDYEALALKIASEPPFCAFLKDKLARNHMTFPLFDTARFTRHIEAAYTTMWQRSQRGEPPHSFAVDPV